MLLLIRQILIKQLCRVQVYKTKHKNDLVEYCNQRKKHTNQIITVFMKQFNLKDPLLMQQGSSKHKMEFQLDYEPIETEGECILKSVTPLKFKTCHFIAFCILSILTAGIPIVLVYWYPRLKIKAYYEPCHYQQSTHFGILNYDGQTTIVPRKKQIYRNMANSTYNRAIVDNPQQMGAGDNFGAEETVNYFINRYMKYRIIPNDRGTVVRADIYDYEHGIKQLITNNFGNKQKIQGYDDQTVQQLRKRYGIGTMVIERPGLGVLFCREIVQPLYFFIIFTIIVWMNQYYQIYATIIFVTMTAGLIINLYQTYTLNNKIYDMAYFQTNVNVLRNRQVVTISSKDVVPGDLVFLKEAMKIPFDAIILENSALLNQCALNGESVPVVKKAEDIYHLNKQIIQDKNYKLPHKSNLIYEGTTLIQVDNKKIMRIFEEFRQQFGVPVYVIRTNFVTLKGQLIRIISFPIEKVNIFQRQSFKFLFFLFGLAVVSYFFIVLRLYKYIEPRDLFIKFLDLITVTVPPGLPVSMTFGIIHAIQKLKKKDIYCVSPNKVILGGLVDFICFDKTGTLTEDFMDFKCLVPSHNGRFKQTIDNPQINENSKLSYSLQKIVRQNKDLQNFQQILSNMASNHTITNIRATDQNVGDPMELKLFQFGQYKFSEEAVDRYKQSNDKNKQEILFGFSNKRGHLGVVTRRMDFDSELLRMSVIASTQINGRSATYIYTKGSPQIIDSICRPETIPKNYHQVLKYHASSGFRVLAICHRQLRQEQRALQRVQIERNMEFDGFQIFQNKLKPETKGALRQLQKSGIPCVMITGDNALTGSNMAYKSGIATIAKQLVVFNYKVHERKFQVQQFRFDPTQQEIEDQNQIEAQNNFGEKQGVQLKPIPYQPYTDGHRQIQGSNKYISDQQIVNQSINKLLGQLENPNHQLCLTGSAFNFLFGGGDLQKMDSSRKCILSQTKVFARASPNDKTRIVMAFQQGLNKVVSMCGDGANDCGALKQSDAGLSLSQTQASISAPFTSKVANIGSMVQLIKQCRAGLVTNFSLFNIMAMYSLIQYTSSVICQYFFTYPTEPCFLYWDLFGNFFFFMVFGFTQTADTLSKERPSRSLFTFLNLLQVGIMYVTQLAGQILMVFSLSHFFSQEVNYWQIGGSEQNYKKYLQNDNNFVTKTIESNILFLFSNFMYIFSFIGFSISKPWRKQFYTNIPFMIVFFFVFTYSVLIVVFIPSRHPVLQLQYLNHNLVNLFILLSSLIFGMVMYINQKCILQPISQKIRAKYPDKIWL